MKRLLVFQHVPHEILGNLDPLLRAAGFRIRYVNFGRTPDAQPDITRYDGLIVLGGPMCVDQTNRHPHLLTEIAAISDAIDRGMPLLGICLGAQLIATALGAKVRRNPVKEIGWYGVQPTVAARTDPLFRHLGEMERIFQWHGDTFDIPRGAIHLARSEHCENQAFRYGELTYGLQFHLEVDASLIDRWLATPVNRRELQTLGPAITPEEILAATPEHIGRSSRLGDQVFGEFIRLFSTRQRRRTLPSR
ncbi:MAG: gamma-glutamyl-gamma-aminobutyrate hydrolase family protein [Gammaproteobacteria bacterium]|nr:gamma-glutamyl-gamma-aminobutyrate hydrolase family protein [Gammaproteobacteria bacterium]